MAKIRLTDKEFWRILRESAGIYSRAARAIRNKYGIEYTRQAVQQRAAKKPELLDDILAETFEVAEEGLQTLIRHQDPKIKIKAIDTFMKYRGAKYGYLLHTNAELTGKDGKDLIPPARILTKEEAREYLNDIENEC